MMGGGADFMRSMSSAEVLMVPEVDVTGVRPMFPGSFSGWDWTQQGLGIEKPNMVGEIATAVNPVMALGRSIAGLIIGRDPVTLEPQSQIESAAAIALGQVKISKALGNVKFPSAKEVASRLGMTEERFHHQIKAALKVDFKELRNMKNFDVGIDKAGNIAFKDRSTGRTIQTDVPLNSYGRLGE